MTCARQKTASQMRETKEDLMMAEERRLQEKGKRRAFFIHRRQGWEKKRERGERKRTSLGKGVVRMSCGYVREKRGGRDAKNRI